LLLSPRSLLLLQMLLLNPPLEGSLLPRLLLPRTIRRGRGRPLLLLLLSLLLLSEQSGDVGGEPLRLLPLSPLSLLRVRRRQERRAG
jgi:hypothetical protein